MIKRTWLALSILGLVLVYAVLYIWQPGGVRVLNLVTDGLVVLFALLASLLALRASRMFGPDTAPRWAWLLLGTGMAAMTVAELVWAYYHVVLDQSSPFPSTFPS
jgi:hypothetical protein